MVEITPTALDGVLLLRPRRFGDARGWFSETWNSAQLRQAGIDLAFVQDNHSFSAESGTLRGLHYQAPPRAQTKLVRCSRGAILDAVVDARRGSPTYGRSLTQVLSAENGLQLLVPAGFLHGFVTTDPDTEVQYKVTDYYDAECDGSVKWDSAGVEWNLVDDPILSDKDMAAISFADWQSPFEYGKTQ